MKKKKGFTLVELLAVIVVLAVIALIVTPAILGVIEKAKLSSLQDSGYGLVEAANLYYAQYQNGKTIRFDIEDNKITTKEKNKINYKGNIKSGTVLINNKGEVTLCINDGKRSAYKNYQDTKVTVVNEKTCTIPENKYIVYLDNESTIKELTNEELTNEIENLKAEIENLKSERMTQNVVLWENDSPNSHFGGATISNLDLVDGDEVEVYVKMAGNTTSLSKVYKFIYEDGKAYTMDYAMTVGGAYGYAMGRNINFSGTSIIFSGGWYQNYNSTVVTNNNSMLVPLKVVRIRY